MAYDAWFARCSSGKLWFVLATDTGPVRGAVNVESVSYALRTTRSRGIELNNIGICDIDMIR